MNTETVRIQLQRNSKLHEDCFILRPADVDLLLSYLEYHLKRAARELHVPPSIYAIVRNIMRVFLGIRNPLDIPYTSDTVEVPPHHLPIVLVSEYDEKVLGKWKLTWFIIPESPLHDKPFTVALA